jgi:hypothetical protein
MTDHEHDQEVLRFNRARIRVPWARKKRFGREGRGCRGPGI